MCKKLPDGSCPCEDGKGWNAFSDKLKNQYKSPENKGYESDIKRVYSQLRNKTMEYGVAGNYSYLPTKTYSTQTNVNYINLKTYSEKPKENTKMTYSIKNEYKKEENQISFSTFFNYKLAKLKEEIKSEESPYYTNLLTKYIKKSEKKKKKLIIKKLIEEHTTKIIFEEESDGNISRIMEITGENLDQFAKLENPEMIVTTINK